MISRTSPRTSMKLLKDNLAVAFDVENSSSIMQQNPGEEKTPHFSRGRHSKRIEGPHVTIARQNFAPRSEDMETR